MTKEERIKLLSDTHEKLCTTLFHGGIAATVATVLEVVRIEIEEIKKEIKEFEN